MGPAGRPLPPLCNFKDSAWSTGLRANASSRGTARAGPLGMGTPRAGGGEPARRGSPGCPSPGRAAAFRRKRKQCQGAGGASGARWGGRGAPPPAVSETRVHHWLYRSKFSAGGAQGAGARAEGEGRGGARPTGLRRRHLFVVLKPGALSSAQLTHNGQLFLAEGAAGAHPHGWSSWPVSISPFRHRHPSWGRSGGSWGRLSFVPRELASGSENKK